MNYRFFIGRVDLIKKIPIILIISIVVFLNGCIDFNYENDTELLINYFDINPNIINMGESANLSWHVTGADIVNINVEIGSVGLTGTRIVSPIQNTTYILTASQGEQSIDATVFIIVLNHDFNDTNESSSDEDYENDSSFNNAPENVSIEGPIEGYVNITYSFTLSAVDPDKNDFIKYTIKWGDGTINASDYTENAEEVEVSHSWTIKGTYLMEIYAEDEAHAKSETKKYTIVIFDNNTNSEDNIIPIIEFIKLDGPNEDNVKIKVESIQTEDIEWDDVEITVMNVTEGTAQIIQYVPVLSLTDEYVSVGDIILLEDMFQGHEYNLSLTYIPSGDELGSFSWQQ